MAILANIFLYYMYTGYHKSHRMEYKFVSLYAEVFSINNL